MTRDDVERITEQVIKELRLTMPRGDFTDPNRRTIELTFKDQVIDSVTFDVVQVREYEG